MSVAANAIGHGVNGFPFGALSDATMVCLRVRGAAICLPIPP